MTSRYPDKHENSDLDAINVIEFPVDQTHVKDCYSRVADILAQPFEGTCVSERSGLGLYSFCPGWYGDMRWVTAGNHEGLSFFEDYFRQLEIEAKTKRLLGDHGDLMMYTGFFVVRRQASEPYYHVDYSTGVGMNALTLMTPVFSIGDSGHLLFTAHDGSEQVYEYEVGKAVAFGADFEHSTQPFESNEPKVFLGFTYGTRDPDLWKMISETVTYQGVIYKDPVHGVVELE